MNLEEALRVLGVQKTDVSSLDGRSIRQAYLRRALEVHPDKRRGREDSREEVAGSPSSSGRDFQRLRDAYELLTSEVGEDGVCVVGVGQEAGKDDDMAMHDILMRAFRGEDVRAELVRRGGWRPGEGFGVDFEVRWGGDQPRDADEDDDDDVWREELAAGLEVEDEGDEFSMGSDDPRG